MDGQERTGRFAFFSTFSVPTFVALFSKDVTNFEQKHIPIAGSVISSSFQWYLRYLKGQSQLSISLELR